MLPPSPPLRKLSLSFDAVFYYVTHMEESIVFYRNTLGLPLISHDYVARFDVDGVLFELVPVPPGTVVPGNGNARLCFGVSDLAATLEQLHERGILTSEIKNKRGGKVAFFRDPDGNELSLWEGEKEDDPRELVKSAEYHI
jgi:catechol 2,3-dioxygenase-like lactoylglutathione lyase family enzyme